MWYFVGEFHDGFIAASFPGGASLLWEETLGEMIVCRRTKMAGEEKSETMKQAAPKPPFAGFFEMKLVDDPQKNVWRKSSPTMGVL
jgi:hypothetical protein